MAQTIIFTFAQDSKTITNQVGYSAYNGTASRLLWNATNANGAPYPWYGLFNLGSDGISINRGTYTDAGTGAFLHAWEIGFWYQGMGVNGSISKIFDKAWGGFSIQIQNNQISFMRASATSGNYVMWTSDRTVSPGTTLYIQVAVNIPANPRSVAANNVSIYVGQTPNKGTPVAPTKTNVTVTHTSSDTSWYNDATGANSVIANCSSGCSNYNCNMGVIIYREFYNEAPNWATYSDFSTDQVRWDPAVATTISIGASTLTPVIGANYTISGTLQTTSGTKIANAPINVWWTTDEATWQESANYCTTNSNGVYSFTQTGVALEDFYVYYAGGGSYGDCTSEVIFVRGQTVSTAITEYASTTTPPIGTSFTISGTLTYGGSGLAGKLIDLLVNGSDVNTAMTDSNGNYTFTIQSAIAGDTYYDVSFTATGNYLGCDAEIVVTGEEDQDTSSLNCNASTTTPNVGDTITLSGTLRDTTTNAAITDDVYLEYNDVEVDGATDGSGNYSFSVTALSGSTDYYAYYAGTDAIAPCESAPVTVFGSTAVTVTTTVVPAMVTQVIAPTFVQYIYGNPPVVPAMITQVITPAITRGYSVTPPVVPAAEFRTVTPYVDILHMWEYCFPAVVTGCELTARPLIVSQLSTHVNTAVVGDCMVLTENYTAIEESETVTTNVVPAMVAAVIDAYAKIAFQEVLHATITLDEELDVTSTVTDTIDCVAVVTDEIDLELEVEYE